MKNIKDLLYAIMQFVIAWGLCVGAYKLLGDAPGYEWLSVAFSLMAGEYLRKGVDTLEGLF